MRKFTKEHNDLNWLFPPMSENDNECGESIFNSMEGYANDLLKDAHENKESFTKDDMIDAFMKGASIMSQLDSAKAQHIIKKGVDDKIVALLTSNTNRETDKLLKELPTYIYNDRGDAEWLQLLHCSDNEWLASYGVLGEFLCMNPVDEEGPYDNAFAYGDTPNEALSELYQWCKEHNFV